MEPRIYIHLDLDAFYCSCEQALNPSLSTVAFAIQQKHIVVTCNYLARARGVRKLQLLTEAKRCCPGLVIVNGEDIQKYRDTSKSVFRHVRGLVGTHIQRLGMDELWIDVTEHILRNEESSQEDGKGLFNVNQAISFRYDRNQTSGHTLGVDTGSVIDQRLMLAAHLASFLRESIRSKFSLTSSGGIACSKLIAKLVGDVHKPNSQTLVFPDYHQIFLDPIEIKKVAGVGYVFLKTLFEKLGESSTTLQPRSVETVSSPSINGEYEFMDEAFIEDDAGEDDKLISKQKEELLSTHKQKLTVAQVRTQVALDDLTSWFGAEKARWLWDIIHARDDSTVVPSSLYPKSIGVEDSFLHCTTVEDVRIKLIDLTTDLVLRMESDLTDNKKWVRWPALLRLTPRFRGEFSKGQLWKHKRTSRSVALPVDVFATDRTVSERTLEVVDRVLLPLFGRMVKDKGDWDLSLINVAVSDFKTIAPAQGLADYFVAGQPVTPRKRNISSAELCPDGYDPEVWRALDEHTRQELLAEQESAQDIRQHESTGKRVRFSETDKTMKHSPDLGVAEDHWPEEEGQEGYLCQTCQSVIPLFALEDHVCM